MEGGGARLREKVPGFSIGSQLPAQPPVLTSFHEQSASSVPQDVLVLSGIGPQGI